MLTNAEPSRPQEKETAVPKKNPTSTGAYSLSDLYHARRLIEFHGRHIRHCSKLGGFFVWNGQRWTPDEAGQVWRWTIQTAALAYNADFTDATNNERVRLNKWVVRAETCGRVEKTLKQLQSQPEIVATPDDFDCDPWLFNVNNGTIDLRTGQLRERRPEDLLTKVTPVNFDPACPPPDRWIRFLNEIFGGNHNLIDFIQRACGYALTGSVAEQKIFFLLGTASLGTASHGSGANGKTTFLETLMFIMGDNARRLPPELLFNTRRHTQPAAFDDLKGCRLAAITEVEFNKSFVEPALKKLAGGERLAVRRARHDSFEFEPTHKLFICGNHIPTIRSTDHALWKNIALIPLNVAIPEERQDRDLSQKLRTEAAGILNWLVTGCLEWQKNGLIYPAEVTDATRAYRSDMDVVGAFLADRCVLDPNARVHSTDLYSSYSHWCEKNDERPISPRSLGLRLKELGFKHERTASYRIWLGLDRKGLLS
jgi:putative DNA primase/helicase